jgi:hypothetical protein
MVALLRKYMRDFAPINRIIDGEESSDSDLVFAILQCIEDINGTPPITEYTLMDLINYRQLSLLLNGSACELVRGIILHYGRNEVAYTDAGVSIKIDNKAGFFLNWYQLTKSEYEQKKVKFKIHKNVDDIMEPGPGIHSEYYNLFDFIINEV